MRETKQSCFGTEDYILTKMLRPMTQANEATEMQTKHL